MIIGAHLANASPLLSADLALVAAGRFTGALLLWYHTDADVHAVRAAVDDPHLVVRLPDSSRPGPGGVPYVPSAADYAAECAGVIHRFHAIGVRTYVLDNEPVWQDPWGPRHLPDGSPDPADPGRCWEWQAFTADAIRQLRALLPDHPDVRIGLAAFADWHRAAWLHAATAIAGHFDFVSAHCYWQAADDAYSPQFGANFQELRAWQPKAPVVITEWGSALAAVVPALPAADVERRKRVEYPAWAQWVSGFGYVRGAYVFLVGGTPDWTGFRLSAGQAAALAPVIRQR